MCKLFKKKPLTKLEQDMLKIKKHFPDIYKDLKAMDKRSMKRQKFIDKLNKLTDEDFKSIYEENK